MIEFVKLLCFSFKDYESMEPDPNEQQQYNWSDQESYNWDDDDLDEEDDMNEEEWDEQEFDWIFNRTYTCHPLSAIEKVPSLMSNQNLSILIQNYSFGICIYSSYSYDT